MLDIRVSIDSIYEYLGSNKDFLHYQKSKILRRAIERELEIIGEAMNKIKKADPDIAIEHAKQIIDTRNWVIHSYDNVDDIIIWGIITLYLPKLKTEVLALLNEL